MLDSVVFFYSNCNFEFSLKLKGFSDPFQPGFIAFAFNSIK